MLPSSAMNRLFRTCRLTVPVALALMWGCSGADDNPCSLSGKVTVDEQPLDGGNLLLMTENGQVSGAPIKADGTYRLECKPGTYKIAVAPLQVVVGADGVPLDGLEPASSIEIPKKYQDVGSSELEIVVTDGRNSHDITLTSR